MRFPIVPVVESSLYQYVILYQSLFVNKIVLQS